MLTDMYSKVVTTIVTITLVIITVNPWLAPQRVQAASQDGFLAGILR